MERFPGERGMKITAASNFMLLVKEVKNTMANINQNIFIGQSMFDPLDRYNYRKEDGENIKEKKKVTEFLHRKVYGCEVMLSNMSVRSQSFQILMEIPEGALPVKSLEYTMTRNIRAKSYESKTLEYFFYFPCTGEFNVSSVNVVKNGKVIAVS